MIKFLGYFRNAINIKFAVGSGVADAIFAQ